MSGPHEASRSSPSPGARIAAVLVLVVVGFFVFVQGSSGPLPTMDAANPVASAGTDPDSTEPLGKAPAADLAALLDGLSLGNEFDGWKIVDFSPTNEKILWIEFGKSNTFFSVGLGTKGKGNPPPPIQTEHYEVGYGMVRPKGTSIPQEVMTQVAEQVATRIRKREKAVTKPAAL